MYHLDSLPTTTHTISTLNSSEKDFEDDEAPAGTNGERVPNSNTCKKEDCEEALKEFLEFAPVTSEVSIHYEFHRDI